MHLYLLWPWPPHWASLRSHRILRLGLGGIDGGIIHDGTVDTLMVEYIWVAIFFRGNENGGNIHGGGRSGGADDGRIINEDEIK